MGILPTPSQTTARTIGSCGTMVAGIRHFSTRTHGPVPTQRNLTEQNNKISQKQMFGLKHALHYKYINTHILICKGIPTLKRRQIVFVPCCDITL